MRRADINMKALIGIIVVLLVLIVLAGFYTKIADSILKKADREICRASVLAQSVAIIVPSGENLVTPDCKTYNVVFFEDHVEINGKTAEVYDARKNDYVKKFNGLTDDIVNRVVAEELRWCWYQFLEGKKSLFNINNIWSSTERTCFLCSEITFDKSVQSNQFKGFYEYTKDTAMPNSNLTYYQYYAEEPRKCIWRYEGIINADNCWEAYAQGISNNIFTSTVQHFKEFFSHCSDIVTTFSTYWSSVSHDPVVKDVVFEKDKKYVVGFIREGVTSRYLQFLKWISSGSEDCYFETYFAYVFSYEHLQYHCSSMMRGSAK
jgi:hypothetical protein